MGRKKRVFIISIIGAVVITGAVAGALYIRQRDTPVNVGTTPHNDTHKQQATHRELRVISNGLNTPWSIAFYKQTPLVSSRDTGRISEIAEDGVVRTIGTVEGARHRGEGGLLGLAVQGSHLYAYYTTNTDNRISRYTLSGERGALSISQPEIILEGLPSASNHNGGRIAFGPDGMLYATVGDASNTSNAQNRAVLSGKILRMTPTGGVPQDNPFPNSLVYSYGHRNPQGLAWGKDGTMYASEFGQNAWDELNIIKPGANYGWPIVEGIADHEGFEKPVQQWRTSDASPSGMTYANGTLFLANLRGSVLRAVPTKSPSTSRSYFSGEYGRIRDAVIAPDGTLWFITNNTDGRGTPAENDDRIVSVPLEQLAD